MDTSGNSTQTGLIYQIITDISYNQYTNVLFIDNTVPSYQTFVDSANSNTFPIVYSKDCSGTELFEILRSRFTSIPRIGFVFASNSNNAVPFLDNELLFTNDDTNKPYSKNVELVVSIIREFSVVNVDFLACDTLNYSNWKNYYDLLRQSTGVIVGASDNKTGNIKYGGDWILESTSQDIELVYFTKSIEYYQYLLDGVFGIGFIRGVSSMCCDGTYIYIGQISQVMGSPLANSDYIKFAYKMNMITKEIIPPTNKVSPNSAYVKFSSQVMSFQMAYYDGNVYTGGDGTNDVLMFSTIPSSSNSSTPSTFITGSSLTATGGSSYMRGISLYNGILYVSVYEKIYKVSPVTRNIITNWATGGSITTGSSSNRTGTTTVTPEGIMYFYGGYGVGRVDLNNPSDISLNLSFNSRISSLAGQTGSLDTIYRSIAYYNNYLYLTVNGGSPHGMLTNQNIVRVNLLNYADVSLNWKSLSSYTYSGTTYTSGLAYSGLMVYDNILYATVNTPNGSAIDSAHIITYTLPMPPVNPSDTVSFDPGNTKVVASGNLRVSIFDPSNTLANGVYYEYSVNGNGYVTTNTYAGTSPNSLYVLSSDISNTILVRAKNGATPGNTNPISIPSPYIIYQTPRTPSQVSFTLVGSGNIQVSINESSSTPYYYLNNVSYYLYAYNTFGGTNLSGNTSTLVYNIPVGILSNTNITYGNIVSYINTGLTANTYTMYVIARNDFGNSTPFSANVSVNTTPANISFDTGNTSIVTPGNLKVTVYDSNNSATNNVYYFYSINEGATYANSNVPNNGPTKTSYAFYVTYNPLAIQTIYVRAQNTFGNSNIIGVNVNSPYNTALYNTTTPRQFFIDNSTNYVFQATGFPNKTYGLYLRGKNITGYSANSVPYSVTVFVSPIASINIVAGNTKTVAAGNLQVQITDISNTALNNVYYQYALNYTVDGYRIDGVTNGDISLIRGYTYSLQITANGHPFWIQTVSGSYSSNSIYGSGVTNNGTENGAITFVVPNNAPNILYYAGQYHSTMQGRILIADPVVPPSTITILNSGSGAYTINGVTNGDISLIRGYTYSLQINANGHPFWIQTVSGSYSSNNIYGSGVTNNGIQNGTITFVVPTNAPNTLYYACQYHSSMQGRILIADPVVPPSTITILSGSETSFSNTLVKAGTSPYTFFIPSITDISNTINVRATNTVGNSSPAASFPVLVYQTPTTPPSISFQLAQSGNVQVSITETSPIPYYYLNNVSYYLYAYNNYGAGTNLSGNTSLIVYNRAVGILANTNTTYGNVVSYVNTGLSANTYTMYIIAVNPFGNSTPISQNIAVYTTPIVPTIDTGNTLSSSSGKLSVTILDASNNANNGLYYLYSMDGGITYGNSGVATTAGNTKYTFTITDTGNAQIPLVANVYSLYIQVSNPVGNSIATLPSVNVYTTPIVPIIDAGNTKSITSGNLTVTILDASNSSTNGLYYLYSTNGITYGNSGVAKTSNTTYQFVINNTGNTQIPLVANVYSLYIQLSNPVGNAIATLPSVNVYTTPDFPPKIDAGNTLSSSSGNLTVSFTDLSNNTRNVISYWYYVYDPSNGTPDSGNLLLYSNTNIILTTGTHQSFSLNGYGFINKTYTVYLRSKNIIGFSPTVSFANVLVYTVPTDISIDLDNTSSISSGNLQVTIVDPSNGINNGVYYQYLVTGSSIYANAVNTQVIDSTKRRFVISNLPNGSLRVYVVARNTVGNSKPAYFDQVTYVNPDGVPVIDQSNTLSSSSGNLTVSFTDASNTSLNNVTYYYYLYDISAGGTNYYTNTYYYTTSSVKLLDGQTQYSFTVTTGLGNKTYTLYLKAKNTVGWSGNSAPYTVKTYTTPLATVSFDTGNTKTVSSGNLKVVIRDPSNIAFNGVSYLYSINGTTYVQSNVVAGTSPYSFYIAPTNPILDISSTIYVKATNQVGNSSPEANLQVLVYRTPRTPPSVLFQLMSSGNVQVTIIETPDSRPEYYYLNNVSYSLYAYNNANGTNLSGNTSLAIYNRPVGILSNTNTTYGNVVSYVSTGLNANTYTMYVIATNPFGNSNPFSANVVVYTTPEYPPQIDVSNTISATAGNLTVSFTDPLNNPRNAISYWYYVYDPSGTNNFNDLEMYSNSYTTLTTGQRQSFTLYGYVNKTYTLYLRSVNPVKFSASSSSINITIYTVPTDIAIDMANVKTVASGNLQVVLVDPSNGTNNGVYYQYSVIGVNGNAWVNANARVIGSSTSYQFYIGTGLTNQTYTINVRAQNTVGNSNPATFSKTVYITPQYPPTIDLANTLSTSSGNLTISFTDSSNAVLNDISYSYYLFDVSAGGTNQSSNLLAYIESPNKLVDGQTRYTFELSGFPTNKTYTLYLRSKNSIGYSANTAPYNVVIFTTPFATVSFDTENTKTVASGNLQVALVDPSNTSLNQVYYWYSTTTDTPESYSNTYVKTEESALLPYRIYISPQLDISSTIYVKAVNTVGNSYPAISKQVIVYQTPLTPTNVQFVLVESGNVQVVITESPESVPDYYYLNNVSYYLYAYNQNSSETGLDGNILSYTYPVGALTGTNATYNPIVSYVNTGLTANTYTMYLVAKNDFGYSSSFSSNIDVYTTPLRPVINTQTTVSATSGNLTVSFTDTANNVFNGIEYLYYMYDISAGEFNDSGNVYAYTESGKTLLTGGTAQSFTIYGYTNKIYTLYLLAKNPIGTSVPDSTNVIVYTSPLTPSYYDIGNTRTVSSGNLQVSFYDTVNPSLNNVYYWYSIDDGYTYSPSYVKNTGTTDPYMFFISPLNTIRTTISIISTDPVGNSAPLTQTFTVFQTPRTPPEITATLVQSGNVLLTIRESATTPPDNYFMNNVSYYYYLYTEDTGDNQYGNVSAYTNYIGSATNPSYADISIYVTGLPNKTSTFYVMAINDVGNSASTSAPVTVYVAPDTPPAFDDENTYSVASGNLQVRLIDTINTASNNAYYWYSIDGGNTYVPTNVKNNGPSTSSYTFYIPDLSNQDYTVSVIAKNTVGSSSANTITKRVYITPQFAPVIDRANSRSYSANYLTVAFDDTRNNVANNIRYLYYLYDTATSNDNNLSGNVAYYTESATSLLLDGTTKYSFDVSGLINTTYTLYLLSKNTVGNSSTYSTDVVVYTIPAIPAIDVSNTLSVASGNVQITIIDTSNVQLNEVYYWYSNDGGTTFANTNIKNVGPAGAPYIYYVSGLSNQTYTWSIMAKNTVGNVFSASVDVVSYTKPFPVGFDDGNTYSVASGNLQITMVDTSNIQLNEVYYQYSIDGGISYANTNINNIGPSGSPYVFWIPDLSNQTYTVYVKGVNRIDESTVSTISKMVYITPQYSPTLDLGNTISATSGNLSVAFDDTLNQPTNNIQYWYYLYDPSNNTNESMNSGAYTYTTKSLDTNGVGPTRFSFELSNLTNKTYTIYLLSKNTVGTSSVPVYANTIVYTTPANPPIIDTANTRTAATGNLLVSFTDIDNESLNDIYYWYSTNGGSSYANSFVKNAGPAQTAYSFYIPGLTNANTTLSIYSKNTVGNSSPSTENIKVYTTPLAIQSIDSGNTKTVASGNLQVSFVDTTNIATNDVYYWYSTYSSIDGWSLFANSFVKNAGPAKSTYMFYIDGLTNSHTAISIKTQNSTDLYIGESATVSANVIVYTTPEPFSSYSVSSSVSGNIQIDVVDANNSPTNEVYYYVYYYRTGDTGPNNSANISVYSNTYTKHIASSSAATFYLNDLSNNQYTVYVATQNNFGSNLFSPALPPIQVYITPLVPAIDNANTLSKSSGNLTVSIVDTVNLPTNAVYYWYSINGGEYGNTGISKISGVSRYSYDIPTSQISNGNVYIVRVKTVNPIGQSATVATSNPTEVYTTPEIPVLYSVVSQDSAMDIAFSTPYNNGNAISRYEYILNDSSVGTLNTTLVNSQNAARITGLTNGIQYSVGVRAVNARGSSGLSSTQSTIPFGVPFIPDVNVVSNNNSLDIYFTTPNNNGNTITRYEYSLYGGSLSSPINTISLTSNNHYTDTNVTNGIQYSVVVRAVNARGAGAWSTIVLATPYTNPDAPIVKLESLTGAFRIYFDTPYNGGVPITYYQYTLDDELNTTQFIGTDSNNSFIVSGVDGTPYTVKVRTFNTNNRISEWSSPATVTPFSVPVSPILRTAEAGIGTIPISFSASTYNGGNTITRYEYTTNNGNSFASMGLPATVNDNGYITYEITYQSVNGSVPLVNGTPYTIQLRAVNARGPSTSFSGLLTVIPFNRPDPPTIDLATPNNHIITILFSAPVSDGGNPIISYEYSINGGATYDTIQDIDVTAKQIQFTVSGLENGNVFSVSVRSRNSRGASNGSNVIEATPFGIPDPPIITGVSKNTRLDIVFDTPNRRGKAIVGYEYFVDPISSTYKRISSILPLNDLSQNVFTIYGLSNGETYAVNVRTVNGFGTSAVSNTIQISPSTTPEAPTISQAISLPGAINVVFNTVANTGGNTITGYKYAYYLGGV